MTFTPHARAELYRDLQGHHLRIVHYPNAMSTGDKLLHLQLHYQDDSVFHVVDLADSTVCPYSEAIQHTPGHHVELNPQDAEAALQDAGWEVTRAWEPKRAALMAPARRLS